MTRCRWPRCRSRADLTYCEVPLCVPHFEDVTGPETGSPDEQSQLAKLGLERVGGCVRRKRKDGYK